MVQEALLSTANHIIGRGEEGRGDTIHVHVNTDGCVQSTNVNARLGENTGGADASVVEIKLKDAVATLTDRINAAGASAVGALANQHAALQPSAEVGVIVQIKTGRCGKADNVREDSRSNRAAGNHLTDQRIEHGEQLIAAGGVQARVVEYVAIHVGEANTSDQAGFSEGVARVEQAVRVGIGQDHLGVAAGDLNLVEGKGLAAAQRDVAESGDGSQSRQRCSEGKCDKSLFKHELLLEFVEFRQIPTPCNNLSKRWARFLGGQLVVCFLREKICHLRVARAVLNLFEEHL